jgi:hypothetical protein
VIGVLEDAAFAYGVLEAQSKCGMVGVHDVHVDGLEGVLPVKSSIVDYLAEC